MDAFCGIARGFGENQRSSVFFPSKCGFFPANFQFSTTSWKKFVFGPPLWLSPDRSTIITDSKTAGLYSRQVRLLIGAKATA